MTKNERKLFLRLSALGTAVTLLVLAADLTGWLGRLQRAFYDQRLAYQYFAPPPTDKLVHVDIDDDSLQIIGRWPWPREYYAQLMDELTRVGAKAVAWDVIFPDPQKVAENGSEAGDATPADSPDEAFASAIARQSRTLIPFSFAVPDHSQDTPALTLARDLLARHASTTVEQLDQRLSEKKLPAIVNDQYIVLLHETIGSHIRNLLHAKKTIPSLDEVRQELFPDLDAALVGTVPQAVMQQEYQRQLSLLGMERLGRPLEPGMPPLLEVDPQLPPVPALIDAAGATGFVDDVSSEDNVVRFDPLWVQCNGKIYPFLGLGLACSYLGIDPATIKIEKDGITLRGPDGGESWIPTWTTDLGHGRLGTYTTIDWFGSHDWLTMYDYPNHRQVRQHVNINNVWDPCETRNRIVRVNRQTDEAIEAIYQHYYHDSPKAQSYAQHAPSPGDIQARLAITNSILNDIGTFIDDTAATTTNTADESEDEKKAIIAEKALRDFRQQAPLLNQQIVKTEAALRDQLGGKAILIGSTASGAADFRATPLFAQCPGVIVHGVVFNSIMMGFFMHRAPPWVGYLLALLLGLMTTVIGARLAPSRALALTASLVLGYTFINVVVLFGKFRYLVDGASPLVAVVAVWVALTLVRYVLERRARARITRRFSSYVDPALVSFCLENPDKARLEGQVKVMSVVFTDLAGFTTVTEKLQERTVDLLNEYLGLMTGVIRKRGGYLNKFLGDGIMFFYGAPYDNPNHASDAVATVLDMQQAMIGFNQSMVARGLPTIAVRAGVSTGPMVVGDAGGDHSDYTVLGDNVNLGARLESANKQFGSRILINGPTAEKLNGDYLLRPIGRITVKGKTQAVMTYEPLARTAEATDEHRCLAAHTQQVFDAFIAGDFAGCLAALDALEKDCKKSYLTNLYRERCENYLKDPPKDFDGSITLSEK